MTDNSKKGSGFPGADDEDELLADFDAWDKNFDSLFEGDEDGPPPPPRPKAPAAAAGDFVEQKTPDLGPREQSLPAPTSAPPADDPFAPRSDDDVDDLFEQNVDFLGDPEPLGELLGPMPLPPPLEDPPDVALDGFGDGSDDEDDGIFTSAPRPSDPFEEDGDVAPLGSEVTRILDVDDELLAASIGAAAEPEPPPTVTRKPRGKTGRPARQRRPTIVRREELERRRRVQQGLEEDFGDDGDFGTETTRIADARQIESLVESAEAAYVADEPDEPEISFEVDDEFYDDIVIDETGGEAPVGTVQPAPSGRRVSAHLVRREPVTERKPSPIIKAPESAQADGVSVVDPVTGQAVSGRAVDPEATLDMRVSDVDLFGTDEIITAVGGSKKIAADVDALAAPVVIPDPAVPESTPPKKDATNIVWPPPGIQPTGDDEADEPGAIGSDAARPAIDPDIDTRLEAAFDADLDFGFDAPAVAPAAESDDGVGDELEFDLSGDAGEDGVGDELEFDLASDAGEDGVGDELEFDLSGDAGEDGVGDELEFDLDGELPPAVAPEAPVEPEVTGDERQPSTLAAAVEPEDDSVTSESPAALAARAELEPPEPDITATTTPLVPVRPGSAGEAEGRAPELPQAKLPTAMPGLELGSVFAPEQVEGLLVSAEEYQFRLTLFERELEIADESLPKVHLYMEAGRAAEKLGDFERARVHYEDALQEEPELVPALRALRRIERSTGHWNEAVGYLETELELASPGERDALRAHRFDLLMACGEQDLARVAVGEILDDAPDDLRARLAHLELAFLDGRDDEFGESLGKLAQVIEDPAFESSLHLLRGRLFERPLSRAKGDPKAALTAYGVAVDLGSAAALLAAARVARSVDDSGAAIAVLGKLGATDLGARDPAYAAAVQWRRAQWARAGGDADAHYDALVSAAELSGADPVVLSELADAAVARGEDETAAAVYATLAENVGSAVESAAAHVGAAAALTRLKRGQEAADALRRAVELDPADPIAAAALEAVLRADDDVDALIALDRQAAGADPVGAVLERVRAARRLAELERYDEAIAELRAGREATPHSPVVAETLLHVLERAGRKRERLALLDELLGEGGEYYDAEALLTQVALAGEAYAIECVHACEQAEAAERDSGGGDSGDGDSDDAAGDAPSAAHSELREAREQAIGAALYSWQRVLERHPESLTGHAANIRLAQLLGDAEVLDDALARAQNATADRWHAVTLALRRVALLVAGPEPDWVRAEDIIREVVGTVSDEPRAWLRLMLVALLDERLLDAAMAMEENAAAVGDGHEAMSLRFRAAALLLNRADDPAHAAEILRTLVESRPDFAAARELIDTAHRRMGEVPPVDFQTQADSDTEGGFARLVRDAELHHHQLHDVGRAIELYISALAVSPGDPLARDGLTRAAWEAREAAPLADLALADLKVAEETGDSAAKAEAYETLARIDGQLRGDPGSALLSYESAADADPSRTWIWRELERAYALDGRWQDMLSLRRNQVERVDDDLDRVALIRDCARLGAVLERPQSEVLDEYRAVYQLDPNCRQALFSLEAEARNQPPSTELAALELSAATYFAEDPPARAAFLTRAGETLTELGELDLAVARFQEASDIVGGYAAALFGWRYAALRGERWNDVARSALKEAEISQSDDEKIALNHLAGVALMDRAEDRAQAVSALRRTLLVDPSHDDAFVRLRVLFREDEQYEDLAQLLTQRLDVEPHPAAKAQLHRALADICRRHLDDGERAKVHLRAILELAPNDLGAITTLSELAWDQEDWESAAETLIARARLEKSPETLRDIFYRLGTIYAERQPDPEWAIQSFKKVLSFDANDEGALEHLSRLGMQTGDWKLALGACERLLQVGDDDAKVKYLHRIGKIYTEGFRDPGKAERAYRAALDAAPTSDTALSALIEFFEASGDTRSMRVHLNRVIAAMRARLSENIGDGVAYRVISRALEARQRAMVPGSLAAARCAAELALTFGAGEDAEKILAADAAQVKPTLAGLETHRVDELLFPAAVSDATRQIFGLLGDRIAKHVGTDIRRYGIGRGDRIRKREHPLVVAATEIAAELSVDTPAMYISEKDGNMLAAEPTSPISIVLGSQLASSADHAQLRFVIGRAVKLALSSFAVPARMSAEDFGVLMVALLRQFDPEFAAVGVDPEAVSQQQQRLRRLIPSGLIQELRPFAVGIAGHGFDYRAIWAGVDMAGNRAGLLASGSARAAVTVVCAARGYSGVAAALADPVVNDLLRFAVSEDHSSLRGMLESGDAE